MTLDRQKHDLVTHYIRAWNLYEAGEEPVPEPPEGGVEVLEQVKSELSQGMIVSCLTAYAGESAERLDDIQRIAGAYDRADRRRRTTDPTAKYPTVPEEVSLAKSIRLRELSYFEYLSFPANEYFVLSAALALWDEGRREEREALAKEEQNRQ